MRGSLLALAALLLIALPARADWQEVSSDHFVIYGDQNGETLARFAERLELFHAAMAMRFRTTQVKPSPSNRVTIFVVGDRSKVAHLAGTDSRFVRGFYRPRAGGTVAVIPTLTRGSSKYDLSPETVLYHEYAHHFMYGLTARTFPRWFVEGFAEFFSGVRFQADGEVGLGAPAQHRVLELVYAREVPIRTLLDFNGAAAKGSRGYDAFYGQSWLLFHYLNFAPERSGQLTKYQALLGEGRTALAAAEGAFGDLDRLEADLDGYERQRRLAYVTMKRSALSTGPIAIRALRPGEAEMMPVIIRSRIGVTPEEAVALLPQARSVAGRYPDDPTVLAALAEAEVDAGYNDEAIAVADRALARDPAQINAHIQKARALKRKVETGALPKESWKDVRGQWVKANKVEHDHPEPLIEYYGTFVANGEAPSKVAAEGLEWAMQLAPFDGTVRWLVASEMVRQGRLDDAAKTLGPLAYSPHRNELADAALQKLQDVDAKRAVAAPSSGD